LFVIGNGSASWDRHNALTILKKGTIGIGDIENPTYALHLPNNPYNDKGRALAYAWITYSDTRIKSQQKEIGYGLKEIMALTPKSYVQHNSKEKDGKLIIDKTSGVKTIGLIAQEVNKIIPEAVIVPEDESKSLWSMDYEKLIPVLIKGMQEQQKIIDDQNNQIDQQQKTIDDLIKRIEALEGKQK